MDNLDDTLLSEILTRIPAETLRRSKVVNKRWYSLISDDPFFVFNHANRSINHPSGLFHVTCNPQGGSINYLSLDINDNDDDDVHPSKHVRRSSSYLNLPKDMSNEGLRILASSNTGLILVCSSMNDYIICTPPTTKQNNQTIPEPPFVKHLGLAAPVLLDPLCIASPRRSNYKVICLYEGRPVNQQNLNQCTYRFKVLEQDKKLWVDSKEDSTISCSRSKISTNCSNSVYYRGALHWLRERGDILAFHVKKEQSWMIQIPQNMNLEVRGGYTYTWFGVAEDVINLFSISREEIVVWVLEDYVNKKWQIRRKIGIRMWDDVGGSSIFKYPIFYDGERLVLTRKDETSFDVHIHNAHTGLLCKTKVLEYWLDRCRKFVPNMDTLI